MDNTHECSICLESLDKSNKNKTTICNHTFHKECIDLWLQHKNICPLCRYQFNVIYKCKDVNYNFYNYSVKINDEYLSFKSFLYTKKYYYKNIQKIGFNKRIFYIYLHKNNKINIYSYIFQTDEKCHDFFKNAKNAFC